MIKKRLQLANKAMSWIIGAFRDFFFHRWGVGGGAGRWLQAIIDRWHSGRALITKHGQEWAQLFKVLICAASAAVY